ncbi:YeiH family protein [Terrarubrum flagellatum]|uniref:YeiH family protein n=1 Tax=Terrirubrum flagellatum TaxID=2895980 RepID=UPI0031450C8D
MSTDAIAAPDRKPALWQTLAPGIAISVAVAIASDIAEPLLTKATSGRVHLPETVIALIIGVIFYSFANRAVFQPGMVWCVKVLLRYAIGLLGLRIAFGDILNLGVGVAALVVGAMTATAASGVILARLVDREVGFGALAGAANAVCGASACLATATVVPDYRNKAADIAFTVVMANAISTLAMIAYPPLCSWLGLTPHETGIMIGATVHDMAQVVGAGYAVSESVGNTAVIVKLFRVFLLLPMVLAIGAWFVRQGAHAGVAKVPAPMFALAFLALCIVNSVLATQPSLSAAIHYPTIKFALGEVSRWGLLIAIAALGLGTSLGAILKLGWRHLAVFAGCTIVILAIVVGGLFALR